MEKYIKKWTEKGFITEKQSILILDDYLEEKRKSSKLAVNITLYTIGAILIGIGIICFIAANDWILKLFYSRFAKIIAAFIVTLSVFGLGYYFSFVKTAFKKLGSVLIFLSCILIGGFWALIGQIYNIHTDSNFIIYLIWLISILPVAFMFNKKDINFLSTILFIFAYSSAPILCDSLEILSPVVFGLFLYNIAILPPVREKFEDFSSLYKTFSIVPVFITILTIFCSSNFYLNQNLIPFAVLSIILIVTILNHLLNKTKDTVLNTENLILFVIIIFGIIFSIDFQNTIKGIVLILLSNIVLISIISALYYFGYKFQKTNRVSLANFFMLIYIAVLYFKIGFPYLDKALFFFLGGVILLSLGIYLEKQKNTNLKPGRKN